MIPYEELAAALERYAARQRGEAPAEAPAAAAPASAGANIYSPPPDYYDSPATGEHALEPQTQQHAALGGDEESTQVGQMPAANDPSQELDLGDVLSDEEVN